MPMLDPVQWSIDLANYSVADVIGYLKGKSSIWIEQNVERKLRPQILGKGLSQARLSLPLGPVRSGSSNAIRAQLPARGPAWARLAGCRPEGSTGALSVRARR
jgi:hypothetical protein